MAWTIEKIERECKRIAESQNEVLNIPVKINGRLTSTLGRVKYEYQDNIPIPTIIEFSKSFIEKSDDATILSVIQHEMAHWLITVKTAENHGHDKFFKSMCAKLGCNNDGCHINTENTRNTLETRYKYVIICKNCGPIGGKTRMCPTLRHINECWCKKCNSRELTYIQNW